MFLSFCHLHLFPWQQTHSSKGTCWLFDIFPSREAFYHCPLNSVSTYSIAVVILHNYCYDSCDLRLMSSEVESSACDDLRDANGFTEWLLCVCGMHSIYAFSAHLSWSSSWWWQVKLKCRPSQPCPPALCRGF